jgi:hypothetical protein
MTPEARKSITCRLMKQLAAVITGPEAMRSFFGVALCKI